MACPVPRSCVSNRTWLVMDTMHRDVSFLRGSVLPKNAVSGLQGRMGKSPHKQARRPGTARQRQGGDPGPGRVWVLSMAPPGQVSLFTGALVS